MQEVLETFFLKSNLEFSTCWKGKYWYW